MANQHPYTIAANALKDEALLLKQLINGSTDAFAMIYDHYQPRLSLFILPFTNHSTQLTNEIIQEVFIKLWIKREDLEGIQILEYYLQRMAKNHLLDMAKLRKIKLRHESSFASAQDTLSYTTEDSIQLKEYYALAQEAIRSLPERRQYIFRLSVLEGYSLDEIAVITGLSKEVIKKQLFKARHAIRKYLHKKGGLLLLFIF